MGGTCTCSRAARGSSGSRAMAFESNRSLEEVAGAHYLLPFSFDGGRRCVRITEFLSNRNKICMPLSPRNVARTRVNDAGMYCVRRPISGDPESGKEITPGASQAKLVHLLLPVC